MVLLSTPHDGHREDVIRLKVFEDYIRDNVASWFDWSQKKLNGLDVERMEDLILVTGCTLSPHGLLRSSAVLGLLKFP